jgi:threonine/homoserine/homoserine lactone efflux protein
MELGVFLLFLVTTTIVVLSPGPAAMAVATQASGNGVKRAMFGIFGVAFANVVYFVLSALGIASLIIASEMLFSIIKWIGVAYLVYLGLSAILSKSGGLQIQRGTPEKPLALFSKGFIVEFANPKALLYFAAILPQFIDLQRSILPQILTMGSVTVLIDVTIYFGYAILAHRIANSGMKAGVIKAINRVAGAGLLFAAAKMLSVTTAGA